MQVDLTLSYRWERILPGLLRRSCDNLAMAAPSSAPEPHQVSGKTCRFAGSTSEPMARSYSSLD